MERITNEYGTWEVYEGSRALIEPSNKWLEENYILTIETDKEVIQSDGVDTATVTATIFKTTGETIRFYDELGNLLDEVIESDSKASIEIVAEQSGTIIIKAVSENYGSSQIEIEVI